ncbi:MAG: hypothetical protein L6Q97_27865, partial [Thermoanaerobaculia bacterium]|nr:hypothetical protein [Thermoanaerobaculia bacterium]
GSGGTGTCVDEYRYSTDGGTTWSDWDVDLPEFISVAGSNLVEARRNCDAAGCQSNVNSVSWTVGDGVPPTAVCTTYTAQLNDMGTVTITGEDVDGGSMDNCGIQSLAVSPSTFTCANVGPNIVTLTVTDLSDNTATCTTTVTVEDNVDPVAVCQDISVVLDAMGNAVIDEDAVNNGSSDACGIANYDT